MKWRRNSITNCYGHATSPNFFASTDGHASYHVRNRFTNCSSNCEVSFAQQGYFGATKPPNWNGRRITQIPLGPNVNYHCSDSWWNQVLSKITLKLVHWSPSGPTYQTSITYTHAGRFNKQQTIASQKLNIRPKEKKRNSNGMKGKMLGNHSVKCA